MLQSLSLRDKKYLCDNALWIIMDPWFKQSESPVHYQSSPVMPGIDIDSWNKNWSDKIAEYLPRVKNWLVICDIGHHDRATLSDIPTPIDSRFSHLPIIEHRYLEKNKICKYIPQGCTSVVYTGFHEEFCILHRDYVGYHKINTDNDVNLDKYIALELTCYWPSPDIDTRLERQAQRRDPEYKYIRVLDDIK